MSEAADRREPVPDGIPLPRMRRPLDLASIRLAVHQAITAEDNCTAVEVDQAELIDRIAHLETLKNSLEALQSATVHTFARAHAATQTRTGTVEPEKLERSIADQIGKACRVSRTEGAKRVRTARDLRDGLTHVRGLFDTGQLSAHKTATVVAATAHLDGRERAETDRLRTGRDMSRPDIPRLDIARLGVGKLRDHAQAVAARVAPEKFRTRCTAARTGRRVTLRPAADGMTDLTAHLPAEQGAACLAALHKAFIEASVNPAPMTRTRGQLIADTLVERLTGQASAADVNLQVQVLVPIEALLDPASPLPAHLPGHGPVPAAILGSGRGRRSLRRLITRAGIVIGGDSTQRVFPRHLAELITARDGHRCSEPYCDAAARQIDHIRQWACGGRTEYGNGRPVCEFHNQLRQLPGWRVERTPDGVRTTTPTGHEYLARPMP